MEINGLTFIKLLLLHESQSSFYQLNKYLILNCVKLSDNSEFWENKRNSENQNIQTKFLLTEYSRKILVECDQPKKSVEKREPKLPKFSKSLCNFQYFFCQFPISFLGFPFPFPDFFSQFFLPI